MSCAYEVKIESGGGEWSSRLLSYALEADSGMLQVALNGRLAGAILGTGRYVRIGLDEVRALKSDPARLLHQRLCAIVDEARSQHFGLCTLCEYVWPASAAGLNFERMTDRRRKRLLAMSEDELEALEISNKAAAQRKRVRTMLAALREIGTLDGWSVREMRRGLYKISRWSGKSLPKHSTRLTRESAISANHASAGTF